MAPTLLPLNPDFTAYRVLLPLQGREFAFGVRNVPSLKVAGKVSLRDAKLDCDSELRAMLKGFEHVLQERLNQSTDVATFMEELQDILESIVRAQPRATLPPASFYIHLWSEIETIGWEQIAVLAPDLMSLHLRIFDQGGREHLVQIDMTSDYPEKEPLATADLPIAVELRWRPGGSLKDVLSQFKLAVARYQDFWTVMEDIDKHVWVMEPEHPSRANSFRRIALGGHCSLSITVDPLSPRSMPECRFFGSDMAIAPLRKHLDTNMGRWKVERLVRVNLEEVLELTFPSPQDTDQEDISANCIVCYTYRLPDGTGHGGDAGKEGSVPDRVCDNGSCGRPFHSACLIEWFQAVPTTRRSFDVLFGTCPHCSHPIMIKCSPK